MKDYREFVVWQKAMLLAKEIYRLCRMLPKEETYALSDQMRRAAISIPSNIAEGFSRNSDKEFSYFLRVAAGSKSELETQLYLGQEVGYYSNDDIKEAQTLCFEIGKMIYVLLRKIQGTESKDRQDQNLDQWPMD